MEASGTFEDDAVTEPDDHAIVEAARKKYLEAIDHDKEANALSENLKAAKERAKGCRAEAERLIMQRDSGQLAMPIEGEPEVRSAEEVLEGME